MFDPQDVFVEPDRPNSVLDEFLIFVFGVLLIAGSCWLAWWNENRTLQTEQGINESAKRVVCVGIDRADKKNDGKFVCIRGLLVGKQLNDPELGLSINGLRLKRKTEVYQWCEHETYKKIGKREFKIYSYSKDWTSYNSYSSQFKHPQGHTNPPLLVADSEVSYDKLKIGSFTLSPSDFDKHIKWYSPLTVTPSTKFTSSYKGHPVLQYGSGMYIGNNPAQPELGDEKVTYEKIDAGEATAVGRQSHNQLIAFHSSNGTAVQSVYLGDLQTGQVFVEEEKENEGVAWGFRTLVWFMMFIGLFFSTDWFCALFGWIPGISYIVEQLQWYGCAALALVLSVVVIGGCFIVRCSPFSGPIRKLDSPC